MATAALKALRQGYPEAHITFAVGGWSKRVIEHHDLADDILDTGSLANPAASISGMRRFVNQLRDGNFDMAISLVRSPLMSMALLMSGIPNRVGLDSSGRGFGYTVRTVINPLEARNEGEIYLETMKSLGLDTSDCYVNVPVREEDMVNMRAVLHLRGIEKPYVVVNPCGGDNPGMLMSSKRWPVRNFAALIERLDKRVILLGGPDDGEIIAAVQAESSQPVTAFIGELSFGEIGALAKMSVGYIGNDTGLTHLAAAVGAKTVMILGPSDPVRYGPFAKDAITLWKETTLPDGGVAESDAMDWDWERDGIGVEKVLAEVFQFLG
jgi:heptosyltransferase II